MVNITVKKRIGIITIATGRYYDEFIPALKRSIDQHLNYPEYSVHFYCFTDSQQHTQGVESIPAKHSAWPFSTLMRFHLIEAQMTNLEQNDFLLYMDADMRVVSDIPKNIFDHELIAVKHPGFINGSAPFELDRTESAYVPPPLRKNYFQGCFWGGKTSQFKRLITQLTNQVSQDLSRASIPTWHDESYLNHYLSSRDCYPLSIQYAWPQSEIVGKLQPYILHLEKAHNQIRQVNNDQFQLDAVLNDQDLSAQLQFYKRLYLVSHEKCQRLELQLAQKNLLWLKIREWLAYYKNKNS